ncbi:RlpA-like double-psi beta-barrel-protein domain-containing protein-containing protein [Hypoxylon sp. FL0890]|nr:RlpA-like double-psi beta-barrel-protein domain-containing protein-containing protein [Hypoxylon sp. FL0890]
MPFQHGRPQRRCSFFPSAGLSTSGMGDDNPPTQTSTVIARSNSPLQNSTDEPLSMLARPSTAFELEPPKESSGRPSTLPIRAASTTDIGTAKPTLAASLRGHLDSALPPYRTYCGRSRRFLFLCILLPAAIFLFVLTPLAIGLGVGLSRRSSGTENLPLPGNKDVFTGDLTYYEPGLGACGIQSTGSQDIASVSHIIFDAASQATDPNANPLCYKTIRVTRDYVEAGEGNRSVDVTVVDRCVGCQATDLDLSVAAFIKLAPYDSGRVPGSWAWLD